MIILEAFSASLGAQHLPPRDLTRPQRRFLADPCPRGSQRPQRSRCPAAVGFRPQRSPRETVLGPRRVFPRPQRGKQLQRQLVIAAWEAQRRIGALSCCLPVRDVTYR